jgi:hypothetical protein
MSKQNHLARSAFPDETGRATLNNFSHRFALFGLLLSLAVTAGLPVFSRSAAQRAVTQEPATTSNATRNAALIAATVDVLKETSDVRQLSIVRPVESAMQSRAEIERAVIKHLDEDTKPEEIHAHEAILKRLGLVPGDFQYRALMVRVLTEQVAGYYEPKTRKFYLADWIDIDGQKPVIAHELTHALQDQHFNLRRFENWPKGDSDAQMAAHALIEGDATMAMVMYVAANPMRALAFLKSMGSTGMETDELNNAPRALRESLLFPYQEGLSFARALHQRGGWPKVSEAFTALPQSTEQVLHPDKYFAKESPVKVALSDFSSILNSRTRARAAANADRRWARLLTDVNGEWTFYLILDQFLNVTSESRRAAAGWAGDGFAVYENGRGGVFYVSMSAWDTDQDAREFFEAYVKRTQIRYGESAGDQKTANAHSSIRSFRTPEGTILIEQRGNRVAFVEGLPEGVEERAITTVLWQ